MTRTSSNLLCLLQDKTLSATLPDSDSSSAKLPLYDDDNTSSISDAQTIQTRDSSNDDTEEIEPETRLITHDTAANDPLTVEVCTVFFFSEFIVMHPGESCIMQPFVFLYKEPNEQLGCS